MKFTIFLLTLSVFVACTNEPLKPYNLNKTELKNAQKAYENSTIQQQKVQSKSIITITKNETKILAMIEIFQNWELDSLEERFEPIEEEAKAVLTYFDGEYHVKPNIFIVEFNPERDKYVQVTDLDINKGESWSGSFRGGTEKIPLYIDKNGIQLNQKFKQSMMGPMTLIFNTYKNENNIILLKTSIISENLTYSKSENIQLQLNSIIKLEKTEIKKLRK